jgi:hypothetical protein
MLCRQMGTPPNIPGASQYARTCFNDALIRTGVCIFLGILGFWYPFWYAGRLGGPEVDSRAGVVFVWTLLIIFGYTLYSTLTFRGAYRLTPVTNRLKRSLAIPALAVLCWLPFLWIVGSIIWLMGDEAFEFGKIH